MRQHTPFRVAGLLALAMGASLLMPTAWAKPRHGVVEDMQPIENRGEDTSERTKRGRSIGERLGKIGGVLAGVGLSSAGQTEAGYVVTNVAANSGDKIGGSIGEKIAGEGPTTRYMVKVRLDEGRVLSTTQLREQVAGLQVGSRVIVDGTGDDARIVAE